MSPEEVKAFRKELGCTAHELASVLKIDAKTVFAWESGEMFPTKKYVAQMEVLRKKGPSAFPKAPVAKKNAATAVVGIKRLEDPKLWELVRKLCEHPALFDEAEKLAAKYPDPK